MKIVRHVARDMRQAMRAIRERLGEDAVILSSRRVSEGVELTAAIDFDAQALEAAKAEHLAVESPSSRDTASARRATPPLRDNDEPVRSKVPLSFDEALREEARLNRTDVPVFRNEARAEDDGVVTLTPHVPMPRRSGWSGMHRCPSGRSRIGWIPTRRSSATSCRPRCSIRWSFARRRRLTLPQPVQPPQHPLP
jgi:hypothetical protein